MVFRSDHYQKISSCVFSVLIFLQLFLSGCVVPYALPVPLFPKDPYKQPLAELAEKEAVTRDAILESWGVPWASADEDTLIYVTDRDSSRLFVGAAVVGWGYGDAVPLGTVDGMTQRDYFVSFTFDETGVLKQVDTYTDGGNHNHCFDSGVCFSRSTRNVPLMPEENDKEAKQFVASKDQCVVYMYRSPYSEGASYKEYVDIQLAIMIGDHSYPVKVNEHGFPATSFGASVPNGYFRWNLDADYDYKMIADFWAPSQYPFMTDWSHRLRPSGSTEFHCRSEEVIYVALTVPKNQEKVVIWDYPVPETAQESIMDSRMLVGRYFPE